MNLSTDLPIPLLMSLN